MERSESRAECASPPQHERDLRTDLGNEKELVPHLLLQQEMMEPVPALVDDEQEEEVAEWRQVPHEPFHNEDGINAASRAPMMVAERREVKGTHEIVL